jgi:hypothetical protein
MKTKTVALAVLVVLGLVSLMSWSIAADKEPPALAQFDEEAAQCRRLVRDYCAIVQQMATEPQLDKAKQEKGLALLSDASGRWKAIQQKYADNPPKEYAADVTFKARLQDFANALEDMQKALAAGQARRSMMACGYGCGLFVAMHEENGLTYALDSLFHLRKVMKTAGAVMKTRGLAGVQAILPSLAQKRDVVLLSPLPWAGGDQKLKPYLDAVKQMSQAFDEWAIAVTSGNADEAGKQHKRLMDLINNAYTLVL